MGYMSLGHNARTAVETAQMGVYDPNAYTWGDYVPTWSFDKDPLSTDCLYSVEIYSGSQCTGSMMMTHSWNTLTNDLNRASRNSSQCEVGYDLMGDGRKFDHKVVCSNNSINILLYQANTKCNYENYQGIIEAKWTDSNWTCYGTVTKQSIKFVRNDMRTYEYYHNAHEAEMFLYNHQYKNLAGPCLIKSYEMFIDSNCTVLAEAMDKTADAVVDVANTIATHSTLQCGVIGHIYPFTAPYGRVYCNATHFEAGNFEDHTCKRQRGPVISYKWGACIPYPFAERGVKYVRMYPFEKDIPAVVITHNGTEHGDDKYDVSANLLYVLAAGLILLSLVIACMGCAIYSMRQAA